jgi:hypothetical protein
MKLPKIKLPVDDSKSPVTKSALIPFGIVWILVGIHTLYEPIYYFRGAYVDFTGHNLQAGIGLIIVGFAFIAVYFKK